MKRIFEMSVDECNTVYNRLDIDQKRRALESIFCEAITVYVNPQLFRDVLSILAHVVDLQTWGRLRSTCRTFRNTLPLYGPPRLLVVSRIFISIDYDEKWLRSVQDHYTECVRFFIPCVRRFFLFAHGLMEKYIAEYQQPPPTTITLVDGTVIPYPGSTPRNFDLTKALLDLSRFSTDTDTRRWISIPFLGSKDRISFPYGYISGADGTSPHGNIFTDDWHELLHISCLQIDIKMFKEMTTLQRLHFKAQKIQMIELKKIKK